MAAYFIPLGRYDEARSYACEAFALAREREITFSSIFALQHLAAVAAMRTGATSDETRRAARCSIDGRLEKLDVRRQFTEQRASDAILAALREVFDEAELAT